MAYEVIMPKAGSEMEEGEIVQWLKNEGDEVKVGEPILEIVTDKVNMEVEAEESGTLLKIVHKAGEVVPVVETIAWIGEPGEEVPSAGGSDEEPKEEPKEEVKEEVLPKSVSKPSEEEAPKRERKGDYDVVVIGGCPAGYVAAIRAAQLGGKVAVVENSVVGGTCLNRGCIPTKTYLHNAEIIYNIKEAEERGIKLVNDAFSVDMKQTVKVKNDVVKKLTGGISGLFRSYGIKLFNGLGTITKDKKVLVNGGEETIDADKIILAGGSEVRMLDLPGLDSKRVLTSDTILDLEELPKRLVIVGGGVIGTEFGQAFSAFGSKVTILEGAERLLSVLDKDLSDVVAKKFKKEGIDIIANARFAGIEEKGDEIKVKVEGQDDIVADYLLLSVGRVPNLSALGEVELKKTERGALAVNEYMQTSDPDIYAPGDVNGQLMLAHAAFKMGERAAEHAMGLNKKVTLNSIPSAVYTFPEVATVGLTEEKAKKSYDIKVGRFNFAGNGRALGSNNAEGFVKVVMDTKYHEILGVHIVGPSAAEIINEAVTIIETEMTVDDVLEAMHGHPTYSEALYEAFADCLDRSIHLPKKNK
ncbi:dihydrolipoyl dehydrogenase [Helcococcus kunzii]